MPNKMCAIRPCIASWDIARLLCSAGAPDANAADDHDDRRGGQSREGVMQEDDLTENKPAHEADTKQKEGQCHQQPVDRVHEALALILGEEPAPVDEGSRGFAQEEPDADGMTLIAHAHQTPADEGRAVVPHVDASAGPRVAIPKQWDAVGQSVSDKDVDRAL